MKVIRIKFEIQSNLIWISNSDRIKLCSDWDFLKNWISKQIVLRVIDSKNFNITEKWYALYYVSVLGLRVCSPQLIFSSIQFSSIQFSSIQFGSDQFSSIQLLTILLLSHITIHFSSVQFSSDQFSSIQFSSVQLFYTEENRP